MTVHAKDQVSHSGKLKRIGAREKVSFGMGAIAELIMQNGIQLMMFPFFNVALGVNPALLGIGTFIFRIWDAVTDPIMGVISDRTEGPLGRRLPYILFGSILSGVCFTLMWWCPTGQDPNFYFGWFLLVGILSYTSFTVFTVPYVALGYELSSDYHERTWIMSYRNWFASIGGILIQCMFWLTQRSVFDGTVDGMRWVSMGVGGVMIVSGITPALFLKETKPTDSELQNNRERIKLRRMFVVLRVKEFRTILWTLMSSIAGIFLVLSFGFYINVYYVFNGDLKAASLLIGVSGIFYHVSCMISTPIIAEISARIGKKRTLLFFMGLAVIGNLTRWWFFTPDYPWLQLLCSVLLAPGASAIWTLLASMSADVTDMDDMIKGVRREASFSAIYGWTMKIGFAVCALVSGFILVKTGFDASLGANQANSTLFEIRLLYAVVPAIGILSAMLSISKYKITEDTLVSIRRELSAVESRNVESN